MRIFALLGRPSLPAALLFMIVLLWFAIRSVHGFHFMAFGDESGHLLGARAIRAGDILYRDFIDAHGPFSFVVAHAYGSIFGWKEPLDARRAVTGLTLLATTALSTSSALKGLTARLWTAALFLGFLAAPWLVQSLNMVNYHVFGGILVTIAIAWLAIPAWLGTRIALWQAAIAGVSLAWLCGDAYSFAPTAILLAAGSWCALAGGPNREPIRPILLSVMLGFLTGAGALLAWMLVYGDLLGYLVFHFINMQVNYSHYSPYGWKITLDTLIPSSSPTSIVQTGAALMYEAGFVFLAFQRASRKVKRPVLSWLGLVLMIVAVLMLNFRGAFGFQDGSFVVAAAAILAVAIPTALARLSIPARTEWAWISTAMLGFVLSTFEFADRTAMASPFLVPRTTFVAWPPSLLKVNLGIPIVHRVHELLQPGERLLVLEYDPSFFLYAGILPIPKFHEYLPWEADYAKNPWFGLKRDLCEELRSRPPPVIVYTPWKVWDRYAPETFMPCLADVLKNHYVADSIPTLYVRRDRQK